MSGATYDAENAHLTIFKPIREYAWQCSGPDGLFALGNLDGSWWVDWAMAERFVHDPEKHPLALPSVMLIRLLVAARGSYEEVTRERAEQIATRI